MVAPHARTIVGSEYNVIYRLKELPFKEKWLELTVFHGTNMLITRIVTMAIALIIALTIQANMIHRSANSSFNDGKITTILAAACLSHCVGPQSPV